MEDSKGEQRSDTDLVREARDALPGDTRAFDELVRRHQASVKTNCRYISGSATDAEDLAQDVFVKAFFGLGRFEGRSSFQTWIKRIKANHCINFVKKRKGRSFVAVDAPTVTTSEAARVEPRGPAGLADASRRQRIRSTLEGIPDSLRIPLILRDLDGMSYRDIASELQIGLSAAKMRVKRGREVFRQSYGELDE